MFSYLPNWSACLCGSYAPLRYVQCYPRRMQQLLCRHGNRAQVPHHTGGTADAVRRQVGVPELPGDQLEHLTRQRSEQFARRSLLSLLLDGSRPLPAIVGPPGTRVPRFEARSGAGRAPHAEAAPRHGRGAARVGAAARGPHRAVVELCIGPRCYRRRRRHSGGTWESRLISRTERSRTVSLPAVGRGRRIDSVDSLAVREKGGTGAGYRCHSGTSSRNRWQNWNWHQKVLVITGPEDNSRGRTSSCMRYVPVDGGNGWISAGQERPRTTRERVGWK